VESELPEDDLFSGIAVRVEWAGSGEPTEPADSTVRVRV
jgi:hypothetical protein